jgi:formylglycine-generating enzyme required for sulfatase activity
MALLVLCPACGSHFRAKDKHRGRKANCPKCAKQLEIQGKSIPDHDVFISYSTKDKQTGDAVCAALEKHNLRCWIAPRDIQPGENWGSSIIDAIGQSRLMVLVYTTNSNNSPQTLREVERAVAKGLPVIPFRLEDVAPSKSMEYFISASHWLDALTPPVEEHIERLAKVICSQIGLQPELQIPVAEPAPASTIRRVWPIAAAIAILASVLIGGLWLTLSRNSSSAQNIPALPAATTPDKTASAPATLAAADPEFPPPILNSIGMKLVYIPAGEFMMGAVEGDPFAEKNESPRHQVKITHPFYMGACEVTREQFETIRVKFFEHFEAPDPKAGQSIASGIDVRRWPANKAWHDCGAFCTLLSNLPAEKAAGRKYRLPTEAEWEYACRAGTTSIYLWGNNLLAGQANFLPKDLPGHTAHPVDVGTFPPNPWGLYDMLGNASEWCSDFKGAYFDAPQIDPKGPAAGKIHIIRGGSFKDGIAQCRCSNREPDDKADPKKIHEGFRIVCETPEALKKTP